MAQDYRKSIKLGVFVITGTVLFIIALYLIGDRQNMFTKNLHVTAKFRNVSGLTQGNSVRYGGINVGAVKDIYIANDSEIVVEMIIDREVNKHIADNVVASIGTDGLMGNRIVNLLHGEGPSKPLQDGSEIEVLNPLETEEMMRAFSSTGKNMKSITDNLTAITEKLKENNSLWTLLADSMLPKDIRSSLMSLRSVSNNAVAVTDDMKRFTSKLDDKGNLASVITDTSTAGKLNHIVKNFERFSDSLNTVINNVSTITQRMHSGDGAAAMMLNDSTFASRLTESVENIKNSAARFEESMEGLQHSWLLRKYFKKKQQKPQVLNK